MSVVSLDLFKQYLQIDISDTSRDSLLQSLLDGAETNIANRLHTKFYSSGTDIDSVPVSSETLMLNGNIIDGFSVIPLLEVITVQVDDTTLSEDEDYTVYSTYLYVNWEGKRDAYVEYKAGYIGIPSDIEKAILLLASSMLETNSGARPGENMIPQSVEKQIEKLLLPYKTVVI